MGNAHAPHVATISAEAHIITDVAAESTERFRALRHALIFGPVLLLTFAVLAFGATEEWSIFAVRAGAAFFLLLWATWQAATGKLVVAPNRLYAPMGAFLLLLAAQVLSGMSAYAYATRYEFMQYIAYAALAFVVSQAMRSEADFHRPLLFLTAFGFVLAVFALLQGFTSLGKIYWIVSPQDSGSVYGPYVNRNHYAGIIELLAPAPFALAGMRDKIAPQRALFLFIGIVTASSAFTCHSRTGLIAVTIEMAFLATFFVRRRKSAAMSLGIVVSGLLLVALLFWLGGTHLLDRFQDMHDPYRIAVAKDSVAMIRSKPIFGWGAGTFPEIYPHFTSLYSDRFMNQAHNDVLQLLIEAGVIGFSIGLWFIIALYKAANSRLRSSRLRYQATFILAAIVGCTGLLFHSFFDFNLHVTANAAWFYSLAAIVGIANAPCAPAKQKPVQQQSVD